MDNAKNYKNEIGNVYGRWTVIDKAQSRNGRAYWLCECSCSNHTRKEIAGTELRRGKSKSCGCLIKEKITKQNQENFKDLTNKKFGCLTPYQKTSLRKNGSIIWKCKCSCGNTEFLASSRSLLKGELKSCGCLRQLNLYNVSQKNGKLTAIEPIGHNKRGNIIWKCRCECGNYKEVIASEFNSEHIISCGFCNIKSLGELKIIRILNENNIPFIKEYSFNNCINPITLKKLRFDFYVNNSYLIEFDGKQHFIEDSGYGKDLQDTQYRDSIKNNYCKENNIPLIRIPYLALENLNINDLLLDSSKYII